MVDPKLPILALDEGYSHVGGNTLDLEEMPLGVEIDLVRERELPAIRQLAGEHVRQDPGRGRADLDKIAAHAVRGSAP